MLDVLKRACPAMAAACLMWLVTSEAAAQESPADGSWRAPPPAVLYLPAVDLSGGGAYEDGTQQDRFRLVGRLALGVHRLSQTSLLSFTIEGSSEGQRWIMGLGGEVIHLRSGIGLDVAALRDLSRESWGARGALGLSYLRIGASWYDERLVAYTLTVRLPLSLLGLWMWGGL